ncbi:transposase [Streptomyces albogriseolus]|uniref:transposase n=1 Tax=Streptomyces albogriseolus TaxID=1887 RepID=UPI003815CEF3
MAGSRGLRQDAPDTAVGAERGQRAGLESRVRERFSRARDKGGAATGPSPVDRRKTGSKHHLITDGGGIPLRIITTAANVNDVTQTLAMVAESRRSRRAPPPRLSPPWLWPPLRSR